MVEEKGGEKKAKAKKPAAKGAESGLGEWLGSFMGDDEQGGSWVASKVVVPAPATIANLGPGVDVFGLALTEPGYAQHV